MTLTSGSVPTPGTPWTPSSNESAAALAFSTSATTGSSGGGIVYMGTGTPIGGGRGNTHGLEAGTRPGAPVWMSPDDAVADFGNWNQKQINDLVAKGIVGGQLQPGAGQAEAFGLWQKLVNMAAIFGAKGNQVSPFDVLSTYVTDSNAAGVWKTSSDGMFRTNSITGAKEYIGPKFKTTTATAVTLTDPTTAKAVATSVFQQMLGRDPLPGELNTYASALQQAEQANPTTIATTNQYDSNGNIVAVTKQNQKGGYSADARNFLAAQQAKSNPDYGATQAATTYENAFQNAVFGAPK